MDAEHEERKRAMIEGETERKARRRQRGRSTSMRRFLKKQHNVVDAKREQVREAMEKKGKDKEERENETSTDKKELRALKRFKM